MADRLSKYVTSSLVRETVTAIRLVNPSQPRAGVVPRSPYCLRKVDPWFHRRCSEMRFAKGQGASARHAIAKARVESRCPLTGESVGLPALPVSMKNRIAAPYHVSQYTNTITVACSAALTTSSNLRALVFASFSFAATSGTDSKKLRM
jgi:hypothetical protein